VQAALEPLFATDPVLQKVRRGEPITPEELDQLNSLLHTRNPNVDLGTLREFYPDTAVPLSQILRAIVGLDYGGVDAKFTAFAQSHALTSQQLRFLAMLKDHIRQFGAIAGTTFRRAVQLPPCRGLGRRLPQPNPTRRAGGAGARLW
jgi:type I restriction enzyme R subunit